MITVLLADDDVIVAEGLASLLEDDFEVLQTVNNGRQLLDSARLLKPTVIVTDISMPSLGGLEAVRQLVNEGIPSKIVILTQHRETAFAVAAFRAGASAFLLKQSAGEELIKAIYEVSQGRQYVTGLMSSDLLHALVAAEDRTPRQVLTARQKEVLRLIADGRTAKEMAALLGISTRTAEGHKYEIMDVLDARNTAQLIQKAMKLGLITAE